MSGSYEQGEITDPTTNNELVEIASGDASGNKATVTSSGAIKNDGSAVNQPVIGNVASGISDSGNPIKIGGIYNSPIPTFLNGQRTDLQATGTGQVRVADLISVSGQYRAQSITTTASEALGSTTILSNRKMLSLTPTNGTIYWGFDNSVTTSTGNPIFKNQNITFAIGPNVHIYLISAGTIDCRISEGS